MAKITIYGEKQYYLSKYKEKQYLDGSDRDNTLIEAALLSGKGLESEEFEIYTAYGETKEDAEKSLNAFLSQKSIHPLITNKIISE